MPRAPSDLIGRLRRYVAPFGIRVVPGNLDLEKPGEFDGPMISINPVHPLVDRGFYLTHAVGSIYQWSTNYEGARTVFADLRAASDTRHRKPAEFERALHEYRRFEERSSEHAVWMLRDAGLQALIPGYTVFFRGDIEAMTIFHRTGHEPSWPQFYREWESRVRRGEVRVEPFRPKPVRWFRPVGIERQEILQERD